MKIRQTPMPHELRDAFLADGAESIRRYEANVAKDDGYSILLGREPTVEGDMRWHLSVAHPARLPEWEHIVEIAHELRPGVCFVIAVPPRSWWINVHPHTIHLWELQDRALESSWRAERQGHAPS